VTLVTSQGILLRSHPYSETSRILRFLTPGHGLVSVVGKGVRTSGGKGGTRLESFHEGTLTWSHRVGRDLHTLTEFQPGRGRLPLGQDVRRLLGASLLAELLLAHALEGRDPELYDWIRESLGRIAAAEGDELAGEILAGAWRTLVHFGFAPELEGCVRCGSPVDDWDEEHARFDVGAGGFRCPACGGGGPRLGPGARAHLRSLVAGGVPMPLPGAPAHFRILERYALHHLGERRPFRTFAMLSPWLGEE
jgi:DNA repair protein RecO